MPNALVLLGCKRLFLGCRFFLAAVGRYKTFYLLNYRLLRLIEGFFYLRHVVDKQRSAEHTKQNSHIKLFIHKVPPSLGYKPFNNYYGKKQPYYAKKPTVRYW